MVYIKFPAPVDKNHFSHKNGSQLAAYYNLPNEVKFCKNCVTSNQLIVPFTSYQPNPISPSISLSSDDICSQCNYFKKKNYNVDWQERELELRKICDQYRKNQGSYDCIISSSSITDTFYAGHVLKYKYGMHPLTITVSPNIFTIWGFENLQALIHAGLDNYLYTPNGKVHRLLTRLAIERLFNPLHPYSIIQKTFSLKMSLLFDIPLVFRGEDETDYLNPEVSTQSLIEDFEYFTSKKSEETFISGTSIAELKEDFGINTNDLQPYMPINPQAIEKNKTTIHYLGHYLKYHPQSCFYYAEEHGGFKASPVRNPGTYRSYNCIENRLDDFYFYTNYIKYGHGHATYDAAQEIRNGDITRDEALTNIKRFDGEWPERFSGEIFDYLSITIEDYPLASTMFEQQYMDKRYFLFLADQFRSPHLWRWYNHKWQLRENVWGSIQEKKKIKEPNANWYCQPGKI